MNSLSYHESHSHGSLGLPFQAYSQEDPYGQYFVPYHWHEEVEFIYVTKGSLVLRTQNRTRLLQEGHIYFINPGTLHGLFGNSPFSHHYALVFRLDMLNFLQTDSCQTSYLVPLCTGKYLFPDSEALAPELTAQIAALIKKAADEYRNCDTSLTAALSIKITLLQILELLFASQSFIPGTQAGETSGDVNPLKAVFSYIESHYGEKISLEDLAGTIHMNRNYFCRFFKEKAGKTPFSYLNEYRVNQAASQLLYTRLPITEIALNAGLENMSYFIRQFRRCKGCTPSAYRNTEDPKSLPIPFLHSVSVFPSGSHLFFCAGYPLEHNHKQHTFNNGSR
mgnify:CR=1 FL=1